jgi:hypothetical protein
MTWLVSCVTFALPFSLQMIQDEMVSAMRDDRSLGCSELSRSVLMPQLKILALLFVQEVYELFF